MKEKTKKILITILIILLSPIFIYLLIDGKNLYIDMYNFRQLNKAKNVLKDLDRDDKQFFYLKDFNEIYNADIKSIKNCYYLRSYKSEDRVPYTFGFKLESYIYIYIYGTEYYAYPKYDIPVQNLCLGFYPRGVAPGDSGGCVDGNRRSFEETVSNPCRN